MTDDTITIGGHSQYDENEEFLTKAKLARDHNKTEAEKKRLERIREPETAFTRASLVSYASDFLKEYTETRKVKLKKTREVVTRTNPVYHERIKGFLNKSFFIMDIDYPHIVEYLSNLDSEINQYNIEETIKDDNQYTIYEALLTKRDAIKYLHDLLIRLNPNRAREILKEAIVELLKEFKEVDLDEHYHAEAVKRITVIITNYEEMNIRLNDITATELKNKLINVEGTIVSYDDSSRVNIIKHAWTCDECGLAWKSSGFRRPSKCADPDCKSRSVLDDNNNSDISDYIYIRISQPYELSRKANGMSERGLIAKLVKIQDSEFVKFFYQNMSPGTTVKVTGTVVLNQADKSTPEIFTTEIDAFNIEFIGSNNVTHEYNESLMGVVKAIPYSHIDGHVTKLVRSICPHLYGREREKLATMLLMIGAYPMRRTAGTRMKGDLTMGFFGDSSTAKSDFGYAVQAILPESNRIAGGSKVTSSVSMLAIVDNINNVKSVSLGPLPLCDQRGVFIADELDKRGAAELEDLSLAMDDNQQVPINKWGLHHTIHTRCPILLIANPNKNGGKWSRHLSIFEQTNFQNWLISKIDLVFIFHESSDRSEKERQMEHVKSEYDKIILEDDYIKKTGDMAYLDNLAAKLELDTKMGKFDDIYPIEYLRHEVKYLRELKPKLLSSSPAYALIQKFWLNYSQINLLESQVDAKENMTGDVKIASMDMRKWNSLMRISIAVAKMYRHHEVTLKDAEIAIELMQYSIGSLVPDMTPLENDHTTRAHEKNDIFSKMLGKGSLTSIHREIMSSVRQKRSMYRKLIVRKFRILHQIFTTQGIERCPTCRGRGHNIDISTKEMYKCDDCKGKGGNEISFTYNDCVDMLKDQAELNRVEFREYFNKYLAQGYIVRISSSQFKVGIDLNSPDVSNVLMDLADGLADKFAEEELNKQMEGQMISDGGISMASVGPTRASELGSYRETKL